MTNEMAIAHWGEYVDGGGERVAWDLHRALDAPLYVAHQDEDMEPEDVETHEFDIGRWQKWALDRGGLPRLLAHQDMWQVRPELAECDVLVTSGNEPLAYVAPPKQTWVAYTHHTSRPATDLLHRVIKDTTGRGKRLKRQAKKWVRWAERQVYSNYASKPTLFVANSEPVAKRIHRYWGVPERKIEVVYPPVDTTKYGPDVADTQDYYFTWSHHRPEKNIDTIVEAFSDLGRPLVIGGTGSSTERLKDMAGPNVSFTGWLDEEEIVRMASEAKAVVFAAQNEDFGLVPIEALASGTPVIGVRDGFTQYQILEGENGVLFDGEHNPVLQLMDAVLRFERNGIAWRNDEIVADVEQRFGFERFREQMWAMVDKAKEMQQVNVEWEDHYRE